jgi:hypothetical protein
MRVSVVYSTVYCEVKWIDKLLQDAVLVERAVRVSGVLDDDAGLVTSLRAGRLREMV